MIEGSDPVRIGGRGLLIGSMVSAVMLCGCQKVCEDVVVPIETVCVTATVTPTVTAAAQPKAERTGQPIGRFSVPAVGVNVACYDSAAQSVVDATDSAAYFYYKGHYVIGDHVNQGFGALKSCVVGDTAQLTTEHGVERYTCVDVIQGHNTGADLTDAEYRSIGEMYPDTLVCYTCNDGWQNVTILFFAPVEETQSVTKVETEADDCEIGHIWLCFEGWEPEYFEDGTLRDYVYYETRRCEKCGFEEKTRLFDFGL